MGFIELADSLGLADEKRKPSPLVDGAFSASSGSWERKNPSHPVNPV
jgi:hypothetical protein